MTAEPLIQMPSGVALKWMIDGRPISAPCSIL